MKKIAKNIAIILCVCLATGCGTEEKKEEQLPTNLLDEIKLDTNGASSICSAEYDYSDTQGYVTGSKFAIYADENDIVVKIVSQEVVVSNDEEILNVFEESLKRNYSTSSQYGGYTYEIKVDGNKLVSSVTLDYTEMDLKSMASDNEDLKIYLNENNQFTLNSVKSMYMSVGAECN